MKLCSPGFAMLCNGGMLGFASDLNAYYESN